MLKPGQRRKYEKHFTSKLTDADGEQLETQHWLETALDCNLLTDESFKDLLNSYEVLGRMLQATMDKSHLFCSIK